MASVLIPIAPGSEELEAVTLIDLLRRAEIEVVVAAASADPVQCSRGVVLVPDTTFAAVREREFDLVVLPGGLAGANNLRDDADVQTILKAHAEAGHYVGAICAAPKALAAAGLLADKQVTAYPGALDGLDLPGTQVTNSAVQIDGKLITSRGPGTAMDFALTLIEQLLGQTKRQQVEEKLVR